MLCAKRLIEALSKEDTVENNKNNNEDYDPDDVFKFLFDNTTTKHKIRYSDGIEREFSFDDQEVKN